MRRLATTVTVLSTLAIATLFLMTRRQEDENDTHMSNGKTSLSREESLQAIRDLHATIRLDGKGGVEEVWFQDPVALSDMGYAMRELTNDDLRWVAAFPELKRLSFAGCSEINDAGMQCLQPLTEIEKLDASYTSITGEGLIVLAGFDRLRCINLIDIPLVDSDLMFLGQFASMNATVCPMHPYLIKGFFPFVRWNHSKSYISEMFQ